MTCCLLEPLFCSAKLNQARGNRMPCCSDNVIGWSGIAARPKITRDNHSSSRKLGVWLKATAKRAVWVRGGPCTQEQIIHFSALFTGCPESQQWSLQSEPCNARNVYFTLDHLHIESQTLSGLSLLPTPKWCIASPRLAEQHWEVFFLACCLVTWPCPCNSSSSPWDNQPLWGVPVKKVCDVFPLTGKTALRANNMTAEDRHL